jgi:hypothetical protein
MYCGEQTAVKYQGNERLAVSLRCHSWNCEECAEVRRRGLTAQAIAGKPDKFLTLTSKRKDGQTPVDAARALARSWRLLQGRIKRRYGWQRLPFLAVFQATKLGWPHLHILLRCGWIDQNWLSQTMAELNDSPVVDIRPVDNPGRAAAYVARYVTRATEKFGTCKRYWQSQDYDLRTAKEKLEEATVSKKPGGEVIWRNISWVVRMWEELGWQVKWLDHRRAVAALPP